MCLLRTAAPLTVLAALLAISTPAAAEPGDARAEGLMKDALEEDYLATNFTAAEAKLRTALKTCSTKKCSPKVLARLQRAMGVILAGGMGKHADGVEAFKEMLRLEPTLDLDQNFTTDEIQKAYDEAKAAVAPPPAVVEKPVGVLVEKPWSEQAAWTPVPIYVELPEGTDAAKVVVRYRGPGDADWKEVALAPMAKGFGGLLPCTAVQKNGTLLYFTTAFDDNLDRVASGGSAAEPRKVEIKKAIGGRQPALPDAMPPSECPRPEERLSCSTNDDCPGTLVCKDLQCVEESSIPKPPPEPERRKNWLSLSFSPDLVLVGKTGDACSKDAQSSGRLSCFYSDGTQFDGTPTPSGSANTLNGGVATGTMRIMIGYERLFGTRVTAGLRAGFAILGTPKRQSDDKRFFPLHLEARGAFHLSKDAFAKAGVRPYVFLAAGLAEAAGLVPAVVAYDDGNGGLAKDKVDAYQKAGNLFAGGGVGVQYAVDTRAAMMLEVGVRQMFPESGTVIVPVLGATYGL